MFLLDPRIFKINQKIFYVLKANLSNYIKTKFYAKHHFLKLSAIFFLLQCVVLYLWDNYLKRNYFELRTQRSRVSNSFLFNNLI